MYLRQKMMVRFLPLTYLMSPILIMTLIWILVGVCCNGMGWPGVERLAEKTPAPFITKTPEDPEPYQLYNFIVKLRRELILKERKNGENNRSVKHNDER